MNLQDTAFGGSMALVYQRHLVPLIFEPYARELAHRLDGRSLSSVLELAAGTGAVTRELASLLPDSVAIVATDLNQGMLDQATALGTSRPVEWRLADALQLPFPEHSFDAVVCQFGVMFFPDKARGFAEARRVLRPGGILLFNVWDRIEENEFAAVVTDAVAGVFPADPPRFLPRTPYGYHDALVIARDLAAGGFATPARIDTVTRQSRAASPREPAVAFCLGTPLRNEINERDETRLDAATAAAEDALARRFGTGAVDGKIQALVASVESSSW